MANMASITVKKADGTTDVIYVAATPSAGDKNPAVWTQNALVGVAGLRPRFELQSQDNGARTMRQMRYKFSYPITYVDANTGVTKKLKSVDAEGVVYLPFELDTVAWRQAFSQLGNLLVSTLVRDSVEAGYAPT